MVRMRLREVELDGPFAGIRLGVVDWGEPEASRTVLCVHGLTRNARDFDALAESLVRAGMRVLAVDVVGRGRSSWLEDKSGYTVPTYAAQLRRLLELEGLAEVDWVGTSMGGLVGMAVAASPGSPIRRLVLNDIGPFVPKEALLEIRAYLAEDPLFAGLDEVEAYFRRIYAPFGRLPDAVWRHLAEHSVRRTPEGLRLHYDPGIRVPHEAAEPQDIELWSLWEAIAAPVLVLRGAESRLLREETARAMLRRGPECEVLVFPECGHAPALVEPGQIEPVVRWLAR
ncbi:MAG: alpha/beta hydrolase [Geminicoccaceae bacterium]|nr:alpha/beta hydrolase [Geminicoccaceae bacterium]MCS7267440.1 alpha/beta hydrolase [Geminicoccaceae bacterium]MCX7630614.1 alpha/beta hydrolase [Geminicoccaceae bacterium]MDW8125061.1 alpha/beta hydrolase [Geminicoccaceae bacterium]MDW8342297.1 alpha/beta hydrolase [Geminicoccaceae bacterium]